jgi:hypothetical protein
MLWHDGDTTPETRDLLARGAGFARTGTKGKKSKGGAKGKDVSGSSKGKGGSSKGKGKGGKGNK